MLEYILGLFLTLLMTLLDRTWPEKSNGIGFRAIWHSKFTLGQCEYLIAYFSLTLYSFLHPTRTALRPSLIVGKSIFTLHTLSLYMSCSEFISTVTGILANDKCHCTHLAKCQIIYWGRGTPNMAILESKNLVVNAKKDFMTIGQGPRALRCK
jgi:hypothetical protein